MLGWENKDGILILLWIDKSLSPTPLFFPPFSFSVSFCPLVALVKLSWMQQLNNVVSVANVILDACYFGLANWLHFNAFNLHLCRTVLESIPKANDFCCFYCCHHCWILSASGDSQWHDNKGRKSNLWGQISFLLWHIRKCGKVKFA